MIIKIKNLLQIRSQGRGNLEMTSMKLRRTTLQSLNVLGMRSIGRSLAANLQRPQISFLQQNLNPLHLQYNRLLSSRWLNPQEIATLTKHFNSSLQVLVQHLLKTRLQVNHLQIQPRFAKMQPFANECSYPHWNQLIRRWHITLFE